MNLWNEVRKYFNLRTSRVTPITSEEFFSKFRGQNKNVLSNYRSLLLRNGFLLKLGSNYIAAVKVPVTLSYRQARKLTNKGINSKL